MYFEIENSFGACVKSRAQLESFFDFIDSMIRRANKLNLKWKVPSTKKRALHFMLGAIGGELWSAKNNVAYATKYKLEKMSWWNRLWVKIRHDDYRKINQVNYEKNYMMFERLFFYAQNPIQGNSDKMKKLCQENADKQQAIIKKSSEDEKLEHLATLTACFLIKRFKEFIDEEFYPNYYPLFQ